MKERVRAAVIAATPSIRSTKRDPRSGPPKRNVHTHRQARFQVKLMEEDMRVCRPSVSRIDLSLSLLHERANPTWSRRPPAPAPLQSSGPGLPSSPAREPLLIVA